MAIYSYNIRIISRSSGKSAVDAAAYASGTKIKDIETGIIHDYSRKNEVFFSGILLPENAPTEFYDRSTLWNSVEKAEKSKDAQLCRRIIIALPIELSADQQKEILLQYVQEQFVSKGMCADVAIHHPVKETQNPHAHVLLTLRPLDKNGKWTYKERKTYALDATGRRIPVIDPKTGKQKIGPRNQKIWKRTLTKVNEWNNRGMAEIWRKAWADICNRFLDVNHKIDHRSYARQGIDREPTYHIGPTQSAMRSKGIALDFDKTKLNQDIAEKNLEVSRLQEEILKIQHDINTLLDRISTEKDLIKTRKLEEELRRKEDEKNERIQHLLQRRAVVVTRRDTANGERNSESTALVSDIPALRSRADRARTDRADRDSEQERRKSDRLRKIKSQSRAQNPPCRSEMERSR